MVSYTQFSRDATSSERKKLWDPSKTLGIINTDPGYQCITCIGYAPSQGRRCRNPIRKDNREFIMEALNDISHLHPDSPAVVSRLREIAGPALCVRFHQNQAEKVVQQWQRKLQQLEPQLEEPRHTKPVKGSKKQEFTRDESIKDLQEQLREMRELVAKLLEESNNSQRRQDQGYKGREEPDKKDRQEDHRRRRRSEERDREERRLEKERLEKERLEEERLEKERLEKERLEKERLEKERLEKERLEKERSEKEEKKRREREENERIRQKAQKVREEREREKREREQKEREEWDQLWIQYQERWVQFRSATSPREGNIRDSIPWPVKSGLYRDVKVSNVKKFLQMAVPRDANMSKLMRKECLNWHPDSIRLWLRDSQLTVVDEIMVKLVCNVVIDLINNSAGRSAEFLG